MTLLALLVAFGISHVWPDVEHWRRHELMTWPARRVAGHGALPAVVTVILALVVGAAFAGVSELLLGTFGLLLAGIFVLLYVLGPRDLEIDIRSAAAGQENAVTARERLGLTERAGAQEGAAAALHAGLARWFGVLFWFALLGIPGALLYRAVRVARHEFPAGRSERRAFDTVLGILNWPVVALMLLSIALTTDFDRALDRFEARSDRWRFPADLLDDLAAALCSREGGCPAGLESGQRLVRRVLLLWLAVVSSLLLVGVLT